MSDTLPAAAERSTGLNTEQTAELLRAGGGNELVLHRPIPIRVIVMRQLTDAVVVVLLVAAAITAAMRDWPDTVVIALVILLNTTLGTVQEVRSAKAIAALAELTAPRASVVRDGAVRDLPAAKVVPGDLLQVRAGDIVPADARVLTGTALSVDEAVLTGESVPRSLAGGVRTAGQPLDTAVAGTPADTAVAGLPAERPTASTARTFTGPSDPSRTPPSRKDPS
ncbi:MAG TPA: cation-transporting P-type ATPase [Jatrophihabitans sp.]|nr:cation-transporting P-type ATPase [Jatrophihabitans sp.]